MVNYTCKWCSKIYTLDVTDQQVLLHKSGVLAQRAFPQLSAGDRELIISQTCSKCFDQLFGDDYPDESLI